MAEPRIDITRQRLKSTPFADITQGRRIWSQTNYSTLSTALRERIDAVDLTVHELLELAIVELRINNLYDMKLASMEVTAKDVSWP